MKKYWLVIAMLILLIIKLVVVSIQPIYIKGYAHDDALFETAARNVINGRWLGEYNDTTLSKGVIGILFIVLAHKVGISYLLAQQLLYGLACICIVYMLKHVIPQKPVLLLCYIVALFNPISYSNAFSYVYRDGVYTVLILFFIAFSFQMFFHYKDKLRILICYSIGFGLSFAAIYLCREETAWLLPYLVIATSIMIGCILGDKSCQKKVRRLIIFLGIPSVILVASILTISWINYQHYGRFIVNDFTSKEFKDAYGALTRVKQDAYIKRVPLNEKSRKKLYSLSPMFKELEPYLDGQEGEKDIATYKDKKTGDYQEGYLYWVIRRAARKLGYYKDAKTAEKYYMNLANEINELCDSRQDRELSKEKLFDCTISERANRRITNLHTESFPSTTYL